MRRLLIDLEDGEWSTLAADYQRLRARGWSAELDRDAAGQRFGRAALLVGGRILAAAPGDIERAGELLRGRGAIVGDASPGEAAAAAIGAAIALGLPRLLVPR